jgi:hypothetical protein
VLVAYGLGHIVNDGFEEQIVERGWAHADFPSVLQPAGNWGFGVVLLLGGLIWAIWLRRVPDQERGAAAAAAAPRE